MTFREQSLRVILDLSSTVVTLMVSSFSLGQYRRFSKSIEL